MKAITDKIRFFGSVVVRVFHSDAPEHELDSSSFTCEHEALDFAEYYNNHIVYFEAPK